MSEYAFIGMPRGTIHHIFFGGFQGKGESGEAIGDEVYPEYMKRQKRDRKSQDRCKEECPDLSGVCCQEILNELSDIIVDLAPFSYGFDDGGKVVIKKDHVGSFL
jgi:hypothetical protein